VGKTHVVPRVFLRSAEWQRIKLKIGPFSPNAIGQLLNPFTGKPPELQARPKV
jgi:hypothetical protein